MITLNRKSKLVQFTYALSGYRNSPDRHDFQTSLCRFFWRTVAMLVLSLLVIGGTSVTATMIVVVSLKTKGLLPGIALAVAALMWLIRRNRMAVTFFLARRTDQLEGVLERTADRVADSLIWQFLKAAKTRMCPIVQFEDKK